MANQPNQEQRQEATEKLIKFLAELAKQYGVSTPQMIAETFAFTGAVVLEMDGPETFKTIMQQVVLDHAMNTDGCGECDACKAKAERESKFN